MSEYNGNDLIAWGYEPGKHFVEMLAVANSMGYHDLPEGDIRSELDEIYKEAMADLHHDVISLQNSLDFDIYLDDGRNDFESENNFAVLQTMAEVTKTPTVISAAIMPDACPAGPLGTIPVGGVVSTKNAIHPGMHSSDICCSMFLTSIDADRSTAKILDAVQKKSHFGVGGRKDLQMGHDHYIIQRAKENMFLANVQMFKAMSEHLGTQGDGNHFFFVGQREDGRLTFVTHHGSRKPGALLYKAGMKYAQDWTAKHSPETLKQNAWIPFDSPEGAAYWEALQIIREWTKYNHRLIHDEVMRELGLHESDISDRFWNEHNFVFQENDVFHHAKGSTPMFRGPTDDYLSEERRIIPLNMGEDILIVRKDKTDFAPHGAGRYMSRTQFNKINANKTVEQIMKEQTGHIDARFYSGTPDMSELPGAYKEAAEVERQIKSYGLANIVDRVKPLGSMMAGEIEKPWMKGKK